MKCNDNTGMIVGKRLLHAGIGLFMLVTVFRVWLGPMPIVERAQAQIPDPGRQRLELIEELRHTNQLLSEIKRTLEKGTLNVRLEGADNQADTPVVPRRPQP
jgi:hypothetical protein